MTTSHFPGVVHHTTTVIAVINVIVTRILTMSMMFIMDIGPAERSEEHTSELQSP